MRLKLKSEPEGEVVRADRCTVRFGETKFILLLYGAGTCVPQRRDAQSAYTRFQAPYHGKCIKQGSTKSMSI